MFSYFWAGFYLNIEKFADNSIKIFTFKQWRTLFAWISKVILL